MVFYMKLYFSQNASPELSSSFLSYLTWWWLNGYETVNCHMICTVGAGIDTGELFCCICKSAKVSTLIEQS